MNTEPTKPLSQTSRKRLILLVVVPLLAALVAMIFYLLGGRYVETDNAYIKADKVPVSADVAGTIKEVLVQENQAVTAGQVLFRIDPAPFQVAIAKTEGKLAQVHSDLAALKASYREMQAQIKLAQTKHSFALKEQQRQQDLLSKGFISSSKFDDAKQNTDLAAQQIDALQQNLSRIAGSLGGSVDERTENFPAYRVAQAELSQAKIDLARSQVHASLPGIVSKPPKPGQYISAGNTAMLVVVSGNLWVEANFTETDLTYVHPGQPVTIHVDTYPDTVWKGTVDSLSPASGAEFSVIPAQNATGNWVKIAQRVAVKINIDSQPNMPQLRAGLSTEVEIDTAHHRHFLGMSL
jgi:membrane fusion protein (multidrug efflux system)